MLKPAPAVTSKAGEVSASKSAPEPSGVFHGLSAVKGQKAGSRVATVPPEPPVFDPVNPVSVGSGVFSLTWSTVPGARYQVQFKSNLEQTVWIDLGFPVTATATTLTLNDAIGANPRRFYRVGLLP